jgi:AcrR family transcriptional regulator
MPASSSASEPVVARGPGRPTDRSPEQTREELLAVARDVFAERGYAGASTTEIVKRAGMSPSALYHHFGSKAGLYAAVLRDSVDRIIAGMDAAVAGCGTFLDRLDAVLEALAELGHNRAHSPVAIAAPYEVRRHPELVEATAQLRRLGGAVFGVSPAQTAHLDEQSFFERIVEARAADAQPPSRALVAMCVALVWGVTVLSVTLEQQLYREAIEALRLTVGGLLPEQADPGRRVAERLKQV